MENNNLKQIMDISQKGSISLTGVLGTVLLILALNNVFGLEFWIILGVLGFSTIGIPITTIIKNSIKNKIQNNIEVNKEQEMKPIEPIEPVLKVDIKDITFENSIFFSKMRGWIMQIGNVDPDRFIRGEDIRIIQDLNKENDLMYKIEEIALLKTKIIKNFLINKYISFYVRIALFIEEYKNDILNDGDRADIEIIIPKILQWFSDFVERAKQCVPNIFIDKFISYYDTKMQKLFERIRYVKADKNIRYNREEVAILLLVMINFFEDIYEQIYTDIANLNGKYTTSLYDIDKTKIESCYIKTKSNLKYFLSLQHSEYIEKYKKGDLLIQ